MNEQTGNGYSFLPELLLRTPHYSFGGYDLSRIPEVLQQQEFRDAIWLASPALHQALAKKGFDADKLLPKERHTLHKYYNRMCFRPTPFGAFASFTLLQWGKGEAVRIGGKEQSVLHLLPDQQTLHAVRAKWDGVLAESHLVVNPCLYQVGKRYRYPRSEVNASGRYEFSLEALEAVRFHSGLLAFFKGKPLPAIRVLDWIIQRGACTPEEAMDYLIFLTREQVLLTAAHGPVIYTGAPFDEKVPLPGWKDFWNRRRVFLLTSTMPLADIAVELTDLFGSGLHADHTTSFYAALERPHLDGGPGPQDQAELAAAIELMQHLALAVNMPDLTDFIRNFRERFDQEKVPLMLALDIDAGIPYGNLEAPAAQPKLLENVRFPETATPREETAWTAVHRLLFRLWTGDTLHDPFSPLQLDNTHLKELQRTKADERALPQTLALMYRRTGEHLLIESAGGAAATALTGRFSAFSETVHQLCQQLAALEINANPEVVFADIGQLSDTHVDNINRRRQIYPYEIPVNVCSALSPDAQLPPNDLMVSVIGEEVILESKKLGKRVIPRLSTAYNYRHNQLPVFRFLCDLQYQGLQANLTLDLEQLFPGLTYYPRVMYGKTVLALAKWNFKSDAFKKLVEGDEEARSAKLELFRKQYQLPRHISLGETDQHLVFDLAAPPEASLFLQCIKGLTRVSVREYLLSGRNVLSRNKPLAGQMVAFLAHGREIYTGITAKRTDPAARVDRSFLLGSDWLYLKLFCTPRIADELLPRVILPFIRQQRKLIRNWFFIRYTEQGYHLRLRFQAAPEDLGELLVAFRKKLAHAGYERLLRRYQGDTYQRELERYGTGTIVMIETAFSAGSELVAKALKVRTGDESGWEELQLALVTADRMIRCFLTSEDTRLDFLKKVTGRFLKEFSADKALMVAMDAKYRELKGLIAGAADSRLHHTAMRVLMNSVKQLSRSNYRDTEGRRVALLADLVHMQLNRTFATRQREQEMLVYYLLQKHMLSEIARRK